MTSGLIVLLNALRNLHSGAVERIKRMMMIYNIFNDGSATIRHFQILNK